MCGGNKGLIGAVAGAALAYFTGGASLAVGAAAGATIGGTIDQKDAAKKGLEAQNKANDQALGLAKETAATNQAAATKTADLADQAMNRANGKQPSVSGLDSRNVLDAKGGISGTMLTGPQGVDPKSLLLGKTTLLGG
jgi:hypothetical protein